MLDLRTLTVAISPLRHAEKHLYALRKEHGDVSLQLKAQAERVRVLAQEIAAAETSIVTAWFGGGQHRLALLNKKFKSQQAVHKELEDKHLELLVLIEEAERELESMEQQLENRKEMLLSRLRRVALESGHAASVEARQRLAEWKTLQKKVVGIQEVVQSCLGASAALSTSIARGGQGGDLEFLYRRGRHHLGDVMSGYDPQQQVILSVAEAEGLAGRLKRIESVAGEVGLSFSFGDVRTWLQPLGPEKAIGYLQRRRKELEFVVEDLRTTNRLLNERREELLQKQQAQEVALLRFSETLETATPL